MEFISQAVTLGFQIAGGCVAGLFALLLLILLLQAFGVLKKIPFSYNLRNLVIRWRATIATSLGIALVVAVFVMVM